MWSLSVQVINKKGKEVGRFQSSSAVLIIDSSIQISPFLYLVIDGTTNHHLGSKFLNDWINRWIFEDI